MVQDVSMPTTTGTTLIDVKGLKVHFPIKGGILNRTVATVKAVDGVDLFVPKTSSANSIRRFCFWLTTVRKSSWSSSRKMITKP